MWPVLIPVLLGAPEPPPSTNPRRELARVEEALYERVQQVSRTSAVHLLGMGEMCRSYHVKGIGAFFVLAPRALPVQDGTQIFFLEAGPVLPEGAPRPDPEARRASQKEATRREAELRAIEEQVREFQKEAQRAREEAERIMDAQIQEMQRNQLGRPVAAAPVGAPAAPLAAPPQPSPGRVLPPPAPPWEGWFIGEERRDPRSARAIVRDVESAITGALESSVNGLTLVGPDELMIVAVDFYPQGAFGVPMAPLRTLVVRARKKDLVEGAANKIPPEELQKRIEYIQY